MFEPNTNADSAFDDTVELYKVVGAEHEGRLDPKNVVVDKGPAVDVDPLIRSDDYNDPLNCLRIVGVTAVDAVRVAASMRTS